MKRYPLHSKQKKFLLDYLQYWYQYFPISDISHERVIIIIATDIYYDSDKDLLNRIRKQCRAYVMKDGKGLFEPILQGHKIKTTLDAGYIYAPYIPVMNTPTSNFSPKKGIMSKYAKKVINTKYYGNIKIEPNSK